MKRFVFLANEGQAEELHLLSNEFAVAPDGWVQLVPYGNFGHSDGMQRFTKDDAVNLVNEFNGLLGLPQRLLGLPWYIGHPDHPKFKDRYSDTKAYGRIKGLEARESGLFANVKWSPAGEALIKDEAFSGHSINWGAKKVGGVYRPVRIKSVGFTNEPNIPVTPITLANEAEEFMKTQLIAKLGLPADSTDEQVLAAVDLANEAKQKADAAVADKAAAEAAKTQAETALANEVAAKTAAETAKAEADAAKAAVETALANERSERVTLLLDGAIRDGKITAADRERWQGELTASFDTKVVELANAKPVIKTDSRTKNLGQRKEVSAASDKVVELCNERMAKNNEDWTTAWAAVKRENPALFVQMQEPAKAQ
jgi:phage I-like protein